MITSLLLIATWIGQTIPPVGHNNTTSFTSLSTEVVLLSYCHARHTLVRWLTTLQLLAIFPNSGPHSQSIITILTTKQWQNWISGNLWRNSLQQLLSWWIDMPFCNGEIRHLTRMNCPVQKLFARLFFTAASSYHAGKKFTTVTNLPTVSVCVSPPCNIAISACKKVFLIISVQFFSTDWFMAT